MVKEKDEGCSECKWVVKAIESPYRRVADELLKGIIRHPLTHESALANMWIDRITTSPNADNKRLLRAYLNGNRQ